MLELILGNWKILCLLAVIACLVFVYNKIVYNLNKYNRKKSIEKAFPAMRHRRIWVMLHSSGQSFQSAALINMLLRQSSVPSNLRFLVLEELVPGEQDTLHYYKKHHNTVENFSTNIDIITKARHRKPLPKPQVWIECVRHAKEKGLDQPHTYVLWLSSNTTYIVPHWDKQLLEVSVDAYDQTLLTAVPVRQAKAETPTASQILHSKAFVRDLSYKLDTPVKFPVIDRTGRMRFHAFVKNIAYTNAGIQSPLLHPYCVFGLGKLFAKSVQEMAQRNYRTLERHLGKDLAPTGFFGRSARFCLLPFQLYVAHFTSSPPPPRKRHKRSEWQQWVQRRLHIDLSKGRVPPDMQLGLWPPEVAGWGSDAERVLGILTRYGSEREYVYKKNKIKALRHSYRSHKRTPK